MLCGCMNGYGPFPIELGGLRDGAATEQFPSINITRETNDTLKTKQVT